MTVQKNTNQRQALGKGLASLFPPAGASVFANLPPPPALSGIAAAATSAVAKQNLSTNEAATIIAADTQLNKDRIPGITMADLEQIIPNQYQPRRDFEATALAELSASIKANGIIQPLIVRRGEDGKFNLIAGERRMRAAKMAGLKQVPVVIRKSTDKEALELALIENLQREDLNCIDIALSYFQLIEDFNLTQDEAATRVGKDRASVANHLRLLKLPDSIIQDLRGGALKFGHGRALLAIGDPLKRMEVRNKIVEKNLSVRDTEKLITQILAPEAVELKKVESVEEKELEAELDGLTDRIGRAFGTRVSYKGSAHRGAILIEYYSKEDLQRLSEQLLR